MTKTQGKQLVPKKSFHQNDPLKEPRDSEFLTQTLPRACSSSDQEASQNLIVIFVVKYTVKLKFAWSLTILVARSRVKQLIPEKKHIMKTTLQNN